MADNFDPDAYIKSKSFDPDAYLQEKSPAVAVVEPSQPSQQNKPFIPANRGFYPYAEANPSDLALSKGLVNTVGKPIADLTLGTLAAPFHPIQTLKGMAIGAASNYPGAAPSYVTPGSPGYVDPMQAMQQSQAIQGMAKTPQEQRSATIGQMLTTMGAPEAGPAAGRAAKSIGEELENFGSPKNLSPTQTAMNAAAEKINMPLTKGELQAAPGSKIPGGAWGAVERIVKSLPGAQSVF